MCLITFKKTYISNVFFSQFRVPAVSKLQVEKIHSTYAADAGAANKSRASDTRLSNTELCRYTN